MVPDYLYKAEVERIIDGDTVVLIVDLGFNTFVREHFRLAHINAPERSDKPGWIAATDLITLMIPPGCQCFVRSLGKDKYGRWLGEIYEGDVYVNEVMIDQGKAIRYDP